MSIVNLFVSFLIVVALVPFNIKFSNKHGIVAIPRKRDAHTEATPRMGGASVAIAFIVSILVFFTFIRNVDITKMVLFILGVITLCTTGVIDDIYQIKPLHKLIGQLLAVAFVIAGGLHINFLHYEGARYLEIIITCLNVFGTAFYTLGLINAVNLIDGLDGLSSGVTIFAALSFLIIAIVKSNATMVLIAISIIGAALGFLVYNFNPAKIFIGDTGSMLYGFVLAVLSLNLGFERFDILNLLAPIVILALPVFDTSYAILRRIIHHIPISQPDKNHTHHKLMRKGFSHRMTVIILYVFCITFGILGVYAYISDSFIYIIMALVLLIILMKLISEKQNEKKHESKSMK